MSPRLHFLWHSVSRNEIAHVWITLLDYEHEPDYWASRHAQSPTVHRLGYVFCHGFRQYGYGRLELR